MADQSAAAARAARTPEELLAEMQTASGSGPWREARRALLGDTAVRWCLAFLALVVIASLLAPLWPLPSPIAIALQREPRAPVPPWRELGHGGFVPRYWQLSRLDQGLVDLRLALFGDWQTGPWLGTDAQGRDLLARVVWGSRTSIVAALAASAASLLLGVGAGALAGWRGGRVDALIMRLVDVLYSIPFVFAVIFLLTAAGEYRAELARLGIGREAIFYAAIGAISWLTMARVVRGQVLALKRAGFVEAARALGASGARVLLVHVLPNCLPVIAVYLALTVPAVMLSEAFLSFLGLGIEPPRVSWGSLASEGIASLSPLAPSWWLAVVPIGAMASVLLALGVLGDGLRDALDPRRRERGA